MSTYLTPDEVAKRFRVTPKTVREWLRSGELIGLKIGKSWRVKERDLTRFLDEKRARVLLERAANDRPDQRWALKSCRQCGDFLAVPASQLNTQTFVCSTACKMEYDASLAAVVGLESHEYDANRAEVAPYA